MSTICSLAIFTISGEKSKSENVAKVIKFLKQSGVKYKLTPMSTVIECETLKEVLQIICDCYALFDKSQRVYINASFDIDESKEDAIHAKVNSVKEKLN